jgi:hypothetical protein
MNYTLSDKLIAWLTLLSGLVISAVAVYYSVAGLVSIFAAAAIPIMIMGTALEVSKLVATVWLKWNWARAPKAIKAYLITAITILMLITSMGIFGYLSKAHLDQAVPTGDVADKVALIDEKIKTERENIDASRRALKQMDEAVDQTMARSDSERAAERAVQIRRNQQAERGRLQKDIATAQSNIAKLNEERAPIAKELRKVEAEVGPIKYIAALIYGDNPDQNLLEAAVRWVIIIIVFVFDPLAVILLLASQYSFQWFREEKNKMPEPKEPEPEPKEPEPEDTPDPFYPSNNGLWPFPVAQAPTWTMTTETKVEPDLAEEANAKIAEIEKEVDVEAALATVEEIKSEQSKEDDFKFLADDNDVYPEGKPWEEQPKEEDFNDAEEDFDDPDDSEEIKHAKRDWKHDHPNDSLKRQRKLFEQGIIKKLPWEDYLQAKPDNMDITKDEAALEAIRWAKEQELKYQQNSEQSDKTLWNKIQGSKNDK